MAASRSRGARWRWWALRAILTFGFVYALGILGVPTLVPYVAALIVVALDARQVRRAS